MMKRNLWLLILVLCMAALAAWFLMNRGSGTIRGELRDFAVKDTGSVVKIFIADKKGNQVLLERQQGAGWLLNGKQTARPDGVRLLLATLHDIEVRSPVARAAYNNVIRTIAGHGIKVELYNSNGLLKTIYVGGPTQDQYGTFMYLENSSAPFIVHIPGFEGYLTPRFIVNADDWMIRKVIHLTQKQLRRLHVTDRSRPGYTFTIARTDEDEFSLLDENNQPVSGVSRDKIISYLQFYEFLNYEFTEKTLTAAQADSLRQTTPFRTIVVEETGGQSTRVDLWRRPQTSSTVHKSDPAGVPFSYDIDRMNATLNGDTTLLVVQYFSFEKLFRSPGNFISGQP